MRIDHCQGGRQHGRDPMVVRDDDIQAAGVRSSDLRPAGRAAIDRDDDRRAGRDGRIDGRQGEAVALLEPTGDVGLDGNAESAQGQGHDGQPGQPVRIEVAEDEDPLRTLPRQPDPGEEDAGVG